MRPGPAVREIALDGELDIATYDAAQVRIAEAERAQPDLLVLDLSRLTFVDSSGVRLILLADSRARDAGRRLAVRLGDGPAMRVFTALGLPDNLVVLTDTQAVPDGPA